MPAVAFQMVQTIPGKLKASPEIKHVPIPTPKFQVRLLAWNCLQLTGVEIEIDCVSLF
ncbi:unnamed protein product, partial [Rotaria sp. Silwood2]